ncbi:MAG: pilus assembly protein TadG-related protein [Henriciella sp.]|jgi:Flp pilus assembly protein TadG
MLRNDLLNTTTQSFRSKEDGNTAMMFALALVPVVMIGGFALDYRHLANAKSFAQEAMD